MVTHMIQLLGLIREKMEQEEEIKNRDLKCQAKDTK